MKTPAAAIRGSDRNARLAWKGVSSLLAIGGGLVTRQILQMLWSKFARSEHEPPLNPADRRISWSEAAIWAVASGVGVGLGRLVSERAAAKGWELASGEAPPGIRPEPS